MARKMRMWVERDEFGEFPELDEQKLERLRQKAVNYCLWSLGRSDQTRKQLADKMRRKNCPTDIIESVLDEMEQRKYVDDENYAKYFAQTRINSARGGQYVRRQLQQKGIPSDIVADVMETIDPDDEYTGAREYGERIWMSMQRYEAGYERQRRFVTKVNRRGYDFDLANRVFQELSEELANEE